MYDRTRDFQTPSSPASASPRGQRRGFSFPEVLFAVIVLGIGFIMVAAIFPVALQQSKMTQDETSGAAVAKAAVGQLQQLAYDPRTPASPVIGSMPATGDAGSIVNPITNWNQIRGTLIFSDDPRYAFVPVYRRSGNPAAPPPGQNDWSGTAQIYIIAVQCRSTARAGGTTVNFGVSPPTVVPPRVAPVFDIFDIGVAPAGALNAPFNNINNLAPHQILVKTTSNFNSSNIDVVIVNRTASASPNAGVGGQNLPDAVAEGAYIIISSDLAPASGTHTNVTGRIYRVGLRRQDLDSDAQHWFYELQPGDGLQSGMENLATDTTAICVGRERIPDSSGAAPQFIGGAQDVSIYTTTIPVKP